MTTVFLADDEKLVLRSLEKTLLRAGYDVVTASDCRSGSEVFTENADTVDIAILDLNMPDFDGMRKPGAGLDLLAYIKEQKPLLPVVILTAYDEVNKAKDAEAFIVEAWCQWCVVSAVLATLAFLYVWLHPIFQWNLPATQKSELAS